MTIENGRYTAKITDYGIGTTQAGKPQIIITLSVADKDGKAHDLTWYGSLNEGKAQEITFKTLFACGFWGNDVDALANGPQSNLLDMTAAVSVTIENQPSVKDETKIYPKVLWINRIGGNALTTKITASEARLKMTNLNLKGGLAAFRKENNISNDQPAQKAVGQSFAESSDDVGF